jgi:uncharacterized protein (DUF2141 family)
MKWAFSLLALVARLALGVAFVPACAQSPNLDLPQARTYSGCTLRIHVDGLRNSKGNIGTVIFTSPDGWPEDTSKAFRAGPAPIPPDERQGTAVWNDLPPGDYGVAAIHDENSNAKLDRNLFGIPKEGFGFANNPHIGWGPAPFKAALVHVACPATEITIHILYK